MLKKIINNLDRVEFKNETFVSFFKFKQFKRQILK